MQALTFYNIRTFTAIEIEAAISDICLIAHTEGRALDAGEIDDIGGLTSVLEVADYSSEEIEACIADICRTAHIEGRGLSTSEIEDINGLIYALEMAA